MPWRFHPLKPLHNVQTRCRFLHQGNLSNVCLHAAATSKHNTLAIPSPPAALAPQPWTSGHLACLCLIPSGIHTTVQGRYKDHTWPLVTVHGPYMDPYMDTTCDYRSLAGGVGPIGISSSSPLSSGHGHPSLILLAVNAPTTSALPLPA